MSEFGDTEGFTIVRPEIHQPDEQIVLVKTVQTCSACPSQWDAWDEEGHYYYLRHRHGRGSVDRFPSNDVSTWGDGPLGSVARFQAELPPDRWEDELAWFCEQAGITLAPDGDNVSYRSYVERVSEF